MKGAPPVMNEKIITAVLSAAVGAVGTYTTKVASLEGRLDAIERSMARIERKLYPEQLAPAAPLAQPQKGVL